MDDSIATSHKPYRRREPPHRRRSWCCSFAVPPLSPENPFLSYPKPPRKPELASKSTQSFAHSPQSTKLGLVGRILSPGRVSPIDSDPTVDSLQESRVSVSLPSPIADANSQSRSERLQELRPAKEEGAREATNFDVRLNLRGKSGSTLVLELNSEVLSANSEVFEGLIGNYRKSRSGSGSSLCRIEVPEVEKLNVFRETIELMFEEDITKRLLKIGAYWCIDILEFTG